MDFFTLFLAVLLSLVLYVCFKEYSWRKSPAPNRGGGEWHHHDIFYLRIIHNSLQGFGEYTVGTQKALGISSAGLQKYKAALQYPGPKMYPFVGNIPDIIFLDTVELFQYLRKMAEKYAQSFRFFGLGFINLNVIRARETELILSSFKHLNKGRSYEFLRAFIGTGLLTSKVKKWTNRRKILTPTFHFNILEQFVGTIVEESERLIEILMEKSENLEVIDVVPIASQFMLNTICETSMGVRIGSTEESKIYKRNIYKIGKYIVFRFSKPLFHAETVWKLMGYKRRLDKLLTPVHSFTEKIINQRREEFFSESNSGIVDSGTPDENLYMTKKRRFAMLDTLLAAETKGLIDSKGIREEVDTFTFEGHDTTATALTFTLLLLAHHPEAQEEIIEEAKMIDTKTNKINDINQLKYLDRAIKECLRIYPPVPYISRTFSEDLEIDGVVFSKDSFAHVHIYDLHRDPKYFPDPEKFDPDRFLPENVAERHPFAYVPFSAGPRNCIGQKFALLELKIVIIEILKNFKLTPVTKRKDIVFVSDLVLRSKNPVEIKFNKRNS